MSVRRTHAFDIAQRCVEEFVNTQVVVFPTLKFIPIPEDQKSGIESKRGQEQKDETDNLSQPSDESLDDYSDTDEDDDTSCTSTSFLSDDDDASPAAGAGAGAGAGASADPYSDLDETSVTKAFMKQAKAELVDFSDSEEEENSELDALEELRWPCDGVIGHLIYRFQEDFLLVRQLMNQLERKVYVVVRKADEKHLVILIAQNVNEDDATRRPLSAEFPPREVRIMTRLKGLPHVGQILGWCPIDHQHYAILMEHYPNVNPAEYFHGNITMVAKFMKSFLTGLSEVRSKGISHRDVALNNVLWHPLKEHATVIDFDCAAFDRRRGFVRHVGRERYYAPEKVKLFRDQQQGRTNVKSYDHRADIYSAGVMFWMLLNMEVDPPRPSVLEKWVKKIYRQGKHTERRLNGKVKYPELSLLLGMLRHNPDRRMSLAECLAHPFLAIGENNEYKEAMVYIHKMTGEFNLLSPSATSPNEAKSDSAASDSDSDSDVDLGDRYDTTDDEEPEEKEEKSAAAAAAADPLPNAASVPLPSSDDEEAADDGDNAPADAEAIASS